jgi:site-specific DNA recombinase
MKNLPAQVQKNAVAAIRISSLKQGLQGDSPEDQKQQIERFAKSHNISIKKFFIFMESASKEEQPVQEAIDYCKKKKNNIQVFIIKSIDRFTRGGSYLYDHLKMQLSSADVNLVDIYGVISNRQVNTLEHLDIKFDWSVYSPTKKTEILEAERAKDEMRDIMTRMIGAEIRYVRMGYRVRQAPFGYINQKIETEHGKRVILVPHPEESVFIKKIFQLRCHGSVSDHEIVEILNNMGFKSRKINKRDPSDRTKIIGNRGENPLRLKQMWKYIKNPIYAGVSVEKWTQDSPVKTRFEGLVSIKKFNKANRGKIILTEKDGKISVLKKQPPDHLLNKQVRNPKFPYKRYVMCPHCQKPLYGSASRGKMGNYFPAYHCNRGHYFRVPKKEFNQTIEAFVSDLKVTPEYVEELKEFVIESWNEKQKTIVSDQSVVKSKIETLKSQAEMVADKIKYLSSDVAIGYMEKDLVKIDQEIEKLKTNSNSEKAQKTINMKIVMEYIGYFLEHLDDLLIHSANPLKRAEYFSLIFNQLPTYEELSLGTPQLAPFIGLKQPPGTALVPVGAPGRIRTLINGSEDRRPIH